MSIKTKKINDLDELTISSAADLSNVNFVASTESGLTCKINGSFLSDITSSAIQGAVMTLAETTKEEDEEIKQIKEELKSLKTTDSTIGERCSDLQTRVTEIENKIKTINKVVNDLSIDTSNHILKLEAEIEKMNAFFTALVGEDKLTLAKIQDAAGLVVPASSEA